MNSLNPDFFVNLGDLHYSGRNNSKKEHFLYAYHEVFKAPRQRSFYEQNPLVYTFDDHDFGHNNADGLSESGPYVNEAYRVSIVFSNLFRKQCHLIP
jgi:hypothetical protein